MATKNTINREEALERAAGLLSIIYRHFTAEKVPRLRTEELDVLVNLANAYMNLSKELR